MMYLPDMLIVIAHNIRSTHNVGAILRTADGFGVSHVYLTGYTPYPSMKDNDARLPHERNKITAQIHKTALGAETTVQITYIQDIQQLLYRLKNEGYFLAGLEQDKQSIPIDSTLPNKNIALLLGEEVSGIEHSLRNICDVLLEIPMYGKKESFNVSVAAGIAMYQLSKLQK